MEFEYKAINPAGKMVSGKTEGKNRLEIIDKLKEDGLTIIDLKDVIETELEEVKTNNIDISFEISVSQKNLLFFTRQFAATLKAGIPLLRALIMLQQQNISKKLKKIIEGVAEKIQQGKGLYEAMKDYDPPFNTIYLSMVRVGETTGDLASVFDRLGNYLEEQYKLRQKVKAALSYPLFILVFSFILVYVMMTKLLPTFTPIFKDSGLDIKTEYPITQMLLDMSNRMSQPWFFPTVIVIIAALLLIRKYIMKIESVKLIKDKLILNIPIVKGFLEMQTYSEFAESMHALQASGVHILESMQLVAETTENLVVQNAVKSAINNIEKGNGLSASLAKTRVFPLLMIQMIAIGEETGQLDDMFARIAEYYKRELENSLGALTAIIEPTLMIVIGAVVFVFVLGVMLPIMGISQAYQRNI